MISNLKKTIENLSSMVGKHDPVVGAIAVFGLFMTFCVMFEQYALHITAVIVCVVAVISLRCWAETREYRKSQEIDERVEGMFLAYDSATY